MNSTISLKVGDRAYVPFWVVLEFLDVTPPDPFVSGKIVGLGLRHLNSPSGPIQLTACDFEIKPGLVAPGLPADYLIGPAELKDWAHKIATWFMSYQANHEIETNS